MKRCPCCGVEYVEGPGFGRRCDCTSDACHECGNCPEHCECEGGFVACECVRIDVDSDDSSNCPAHGPRSAEAKRQREQEAADEAAAAAAIPFLLGEDPSQWK